MTLEEQKQMIAEWMGWETKDLLGNDILKVGGCLSSWNPQKGGKDLAEVLAKLDDEMICYLYDELHYFLFKKGITTVEFMDTHFWFQDPDNAPTIWNAVCEVVSEE